MVLQKYDLGKKRRRGLGAWISQHCLSGLTYPFASVDTAKAHASEGMREQAAVFPANVLWSG